VSADPKENWTTLREWVQGQIDKVQGQADDGEHVEDFGRGRHSMAVCVADLMDRLTAIR
jgi:hypothetical protein